MEVAVDNIWCRLTFYQLALVYPIVCDSLDKRGVGRPRLPRQTAQRVLSNWDSWSFAQATGWSKKCPTRRQAKNLNRKLQADPRFLLKIFADFRRYFLDPERSELTTFGLGRHFFKDQIRPDVAFDVVVRRFADKALDPSNTEGCLRATTAVLAIKFNPTRSVLAVVTSGRLFGKNLGVYAFGDGREKREFGSLLLDYRSSHLGDGAKPSLRRAAEDPDTMHTLQVSWSPDGNLLAAVESNQRLDPTCRIIFFAFDESDNFKKLDFGRALPPYGRIVFSPWAEACDHNLWLGPSEYLLPTPSEPLKVSFRIRSSGASAVVSTFEGGSSPAPEKIWPKATVFYGACFERSDGHRIEANYKVEGYQPSLYCLTTSGRVLATAEACPDRRHKRHSALSYSYLESGKKGALVFTDWLVQDASPLVSCQNSLLLLLTKERAQLKKPLDRAQVRARHGSDSDDSDMWSDQDTDLASDVAMNEMRAEEQARPFARSIVRLENAEREENCPWGSGVDDPSIDLERLRFFLEIRLVKVNFAKRRPKVTTLSHIMTGRRSTDPGYSENVDNPACWMHRELTTPHLNIAVQTETLVLLKVSSCHPQHHRVAAVSKIFDAFEDVTGDYGYAVPSPDFRVIAHDVALFMPKGSCYQRHRGRIQLLKCFEAGHDPEEKARDEGKSELELEQYKPPLKALLVFEQ